MDLRKFAPLKKVEEQSDGTLFVYGQVTAEVPDHDGEVCHYDSTVPFYKALADKFQKATAAAGTEESVAPLREMHQLKAVGAGRSINFDDVNKQIEMGFHVVDPLAVKKVLAGVYTGFSQGGGYAKKWQGPDGRIWYTGKVEEISLVDSPCLPSAQFTFVKADGSSELRKFKASEEAKSPEKPAAEPPASAQLAKLSPEDVETIAAAVERTLTKAQKKIQAVIGHLKGETKTTVQTIIFSPKSAWTVEQAKKWLKDHDFKAPEPDETGDSLRFRQREPSEFDPKSFKTIPLKGMKVLAYSLGLERIEKAFAFLTAPPMQKAMIDVKDLAGVLETLKVVIQWLSTEREQEGDESPNPEKLHAVMQQLTEVFLDVAEEEANELLAAAQGGKAMKPEELQKAATHLKEKLGKLRKMCKEFAEASDKEYEEMDKMLSGEFNVAGSGPAETQPAQGSQGAYPGAPATAAKAEGAITREELQKALDENTKNVVTAIFTALSGEAPPASKAASGIGDRTMVVKKAQQTHPVVTKDQDVQAGNTPPADVKLPAPVDVRKALSGTDGDEMLKLARSIKPSPGGVPPHVQGALGGR
jgi:hypothetical protein